MGAFETATRVQSSVDHNLAEVAFCMEAEVCNNILKVGHMPAPIWPMLVPEDLKSLDIWGDGREGRLSAYVSGMNCVLFGLCKSSYF